MHSQELFAGVCDKRSKDTILSNHVTMRPDHAVPTQRQNATKSSVRKFLSPNIHPLLLPFLTLLLGDLESGGPFPPASSSDCLLRNLY